MAIAWQTKIPLDNQEGGGTQPLWTKPTILLLLQIKKTEKQSSLNKELCSTKLVYPKKYSHVTQILLPFLCHVTQHEYFRQNDNSEQSSLRHMCFTTLMSRHFKHLKIYEIIKAYEFPFSNNSSLYTV